MKYFRKVFTKIFEEILKKVCKEIGLRYEISTIEIGSDENHVHFLAQSVPVNSPTKIVRIIKTITAKKIFKVHSEVKKKLWGGKFWTSGYYVNTVGQYTNLEVIQKYIKNQGKIYKQIYRGQLKLF